MKLGSLLGLVLALAALFADPTRAKECAARRTVVLEGIESVNFQGFVTTYIQRFTIVSDGSAGTDGRWTGVEWDFTTVMPIPLSAEGIAAMSSVPTQNVPGIKAACETSVAGSNAVRLLCTGAYPFEAKNGVIRWVGRPEKIGSITPDPNGGLATMRLSIMPKNQFYSGVVSGLVTAPGELQFKTLVTIKGYSAAGPHSEIQVNISVDPPINEAGSSLDASVTYAGGGEAPFWAKNVTPNDIRLNARLHGDPTTRADLAAKTTIAARATVEGCTFSSNWRLLDLALKDAVAP